MTAEAAPLRIAILSDNPHRGLPILSAIETINGVEARLIIANNANQGTLNWVRSLIYWFFRDASLGSSRLRILSLILKGQLRILLRPINHHRSTRYLHRSQHHIGIHDSSVIYRQDTISCFNLGILNAHFGWLPDFRGRSVFEWTILNGKPPAVTVFFINGGIDTGEKIVLRTTTEMPKGTSLNAAKAELFAKAPKFYAEAILKLQESSEAPLRQLQSEGRRYYVMSKLFSNAVERHIFR